MNISAEQLAMVAERLGLYSLKRIEPDSPYISTHKVWTFVDGGCRYQTIGGSVYWSDGDLLSALLDRAAEISHILSIDSDKRSVAPWSVSLHKERGDILGAGLGNTLLEAAIDAFTRTPIRFFQIPASQGDA